MEIYAWNFDSTNLLQILQRLELAQRVRAVVHLVDFGPNQYSTVPPPAIAHCCLGLIRHAEAETTLSEPLAAVMTLLTPRQGER